MKAHELAEILLKLPSDTVVRVVNDDPDGDFLVPVGTTYYDERKKVVDLFNNG